MAESRTYPDKPDAVYLYGTCLMDLLDAEAGVAAMDLLSREGLRVIFPQGQSCCAQPAFNSGYLEEARAVARAQLAVLAGDLPVVVPSGSCAGMMRRHYPELFEGQPEEEAARHLAERVFELSDFLLNVLHVRYDDRGPPVTVTWHGSCHARREMGIVDQPKVLLSQLSGVTLLPMARESECCGFGGTFAVRFDDISGAMVRDKVEAAQATGADYLLSGDLGCLTNIAGALKKHNSAVKVSHLASFLWQRINP